MKMKIHPLRLPKRKKTDHAKAARWKRRRLKYIAVIPSIITMMNGACGFMAIVFASRSPELRFGFFLMRDYNVTPFVLAAYMVFLAMVADVLDGRIARLTRTTSSFGGQLDSLADAISFGAAPAFIMLKLVEYHMGYIEFENLTAATFIERIVFFSAIFFTMCAIVRLARFNVENDEDILAHMNFSGLPSPSAAGVVVSLIIFHQQFLLGLSDRTIMMITVFALPVITFLTGILMVSRIKYPHLANQLLRSKKTLPSLLLIFTTGFFLIWNIQLTLAVGFCGFALSGVLRWIFNGIFRKKTPKLTA